MEHYYIMIILSTEALIAQRSSIVHLHWDSGEQSEKCKEEGKKTTHEYNAYATLYSNIVAGKRQITGKKSFLILRNKKQQTICFFFYLMILLRCRVLFAAWKRPENVKKTNWKYKKMKKKKWKTRDYECKRLFERSMNSSIAMCLRSKVHQPTQIGKLNTLHMNFINILFQVENKNLFSRCWNSHTHSNTHTHNLNVIENRMRERERERRKQGAMRLVQCERL